MSLPVVNIEVDYQIEKGKIKDFLSNFVGPASGDNVADGIADMDIDDDDGNPETQRMKGLKYMSQLQRIANQDIAKVGHGCVDRLLGPDLNSLNLPSCWDSTKKQCNAGRYVKLFNEVVDSLMPIPTKDISEQDEVIDIITHQRRERNEQIEGGQDDFPIHLPRRYLYSDVSMAVREVRGVHLGKLITASGIVTRVSEVKPLLLVNAYTCDVCGSETFQEISRKEFTPIADCQNENECKRNNIKGACCFSLLRDSRFIVCDAISEDPGDSICPRFLLSVPYSLPVQADQVPVGHIPRSVTVHVNGSLTRTMSPGDIVHLGGIFLPIPYTGFQAVRAGLLTDTYLEAHYIHQLEKQYSEMEVTAEMRAAIERLHDDPTVYQTLAFSIAPEIYGHSDVEEALLLLLVGGVTKTMGDGIKIRGDLSVCLMTLYISKVAPRGVYTTGKGLSGVGLMAAVMRDPVTDEMVLEGGALVLADNGICSIDEFDRMDESDRTAIHEVMEQQTISISKAGITTTLNARTRYNPKTTRRATTTNDLRNTSPPSICIAGLEFEHEPLEPALMRYGTPLPHLPTLTHSRLTTLHASTEHTSPSPAGVALLPLATCHLHRRLLHALAQAVQRRRAARPLAHAHVCARTLLGVQRLRFAVAVLHADVDEALRLMAASKESLQDEDGDDADARDADPSDTSRVYIKDMAQAAVTAGTWRAVRERPRGLGRGPDHERDVQVEEGEGSGRVLDGGHWRARDILRHS
ncbi:MCM-domain-containing protein [Lactarius hatsudake]|nr:MCM-domain-containing protein [Lactarius hatsudake]